MTVPTHTSERPRPKAAAPVIHWPRLHDYRHSKAVILWTSRPRWPDERAAHQSAERLAGLLTGPLCGWPSDRLELLENQSQPYDLADKLAQTFADAKDIAFFCYIGPAKIDDDRRLLITLGESPSGQSASGSLPLAAVTKALANSKATTKVVILDWHFGFEQVRPDDLISAVADVDAYVIGALTEAGEPWLAPDADESYLSKYICDIIEYGITGDPPPRLSIESVFSGLRMRTEGLPDFAQRPVPGAARFVLAHNVRRPPRLRDVIRGWLLGVPGWLAANQAAMRAWWTRMRVLRTTIRARRVPGIAAPESTPRDSVLDTRQPKKWTRGRVSLLVAAACIVFGLAAVFLRLLMPPPSRPMPAATVPYSFSARQYSDGLVVMRHWLLSGPDGSELTERLIISNVSGTALNLKFEEPIPAEIVSRKAIRFSSVVPKTIDAGHVFEWPISVAAGGREVIIYKAKVAPNGITKSRIQRMARSFDTAAARLPQPAAPVRLRSLMMTGTPIRVAAGKSVRIALTGKMSNRMKASAAVLAMVKWVVENPKIAKVNAFGRLTGLAPGRTRVTATYGGVSTSATVIVSVGTGTSSPSTTGSGTHTPPSPTGPTSSSHHRTPPPTVTVSNTI